MKTRFEAEIWEQPDALQRLLATRTLVESIAERIDAFAPQFVLIAARGSSDNAARYGQYLMGAHVGLTVALAAPSLFTMYGGRPRLSGALVVGISQSGASPDIVTVIQEARRQGAFTLAVTNGADTALEHAAGEHLPLLAGEERSISASKTYTSELMALAMLATALGGRVRPERSVDQHWRDLQAIPDQVAATLDLNRCDPTRVIPLRRANRFVVLGRGFNYSTAFELALKLKETSYTVAVPYSPPDLLHGPIAVLEPGFPVILIAATGALDAEHRDVLDRLEQRRVCQVVISDSSALLSRARISLALPSGVPEWLSPMTAAVAGQILSLELALARGQDPDNPRGLSKVTLTR